MRLALTILIGINIITKACLVKFHNNIQNDDNIRVKVILETLLAKDETIFMIWEEITKNYVPTNINNPLFNWNIDNGDINLQNEDSLYCTNHVIFVANVAKFYELIDCLRGEHFLISGPKNRADQFFVFITSQTGNKTDILRHFWRNDILKVVLFERIELNWNPYTYRPYGEEAQCGNVINPMLIDISNFTFATSQSNLKYCAFNVSCVDKELRTNAFYEPPYSFLASLVILKERYNLNLSLFSMPLDYQESPLLTTNQVKNELYTKEYDAVACIPFRAYEYIIVYDKKVEVSNILFYDTYMWIVRKPERIQNIQILLTIFSNLILLLCLLTSTISFGIWFLIAKIKRMKTYNSIGFFAVSLGYSIGKLPKSNTIKFLFIFYVIYSMHMTYFYQGSLGSKLLVPQYEKRIKTIEQLIDSKYSMQLIDVERQLLFPSDNPLEQRYYRKVYSSPALRAGQDDCNRLISEDIRTSAIRNNIMGSTYDERCSQQMDVINDEIAPPLVFTYGIRIGHPMLFHINKIIDRLHEHGFIAKWIYTSIAKVQHNVHVESLNFEHFEAAFITLLIGLIIAFVIFILEIICRHKRS